MAQGKISAYIISMSAYGVIYIICNIASGKKYVGQTTMSIEKRWRQHCRATSRCRAMACAISAHGRDAFTIEVVEAADTAESLNCLEQAYIDRYNTIVPNGYNLKGGGESAGKWSDSTRQKIKATHCTPEYKAKAKAAAKAMWERPDTRTRISESIKAGLAVASVRTKRSAIAKIACAAPDVRDRMSAGQKERFRNPSERKKVGANNIARMADKEYLAKFKEACKKRSADPVLRSKMRESVKALWQDPVYKARMVAAQQSGKAAKRAPPKLD